jgi:hypothetical protein
LQNKVKEEYNKIVIMIFLTWNAYFSEINDLPLETKEECFICLESENETIIKLSEISIFGYEKKCDCNGSIHNKCLAKWYVQQQKCPICRQQMIKNILIEDLTMYKHEIRLTIFLLICQKMYDFFKMFGFLVIIYFLYGYMLLTHSVIINKYDYSSFY